MALERTCHRTTLALPWLLNDSLAPAERREVREHLIQCPRCRAELARTRRALELFRDPGVEARPALPAASLQPARSGRLLRRLSWAAMIAAVLASVGGAWLSGRSAPQAPTQAARATASSQQARVIFATGFESGSVASFSRSHERISSVDFETGHLGAWR